MKRGYPRNNFICNQHISILFSEYHNESYTIYLEKNYDI